MIISPQRHRKIRAFSLIEVVFAVALCAFALVGLVGLLGTGLQSGKDSADQIQAANLASLIISTQVAAKATQVQNFIIPADCLTNLYSGAPQSGYVGLDGRTATAANATYRVTYQAGTNAMTGTGVSQVYLMLTWPPQAAVPLGRYELLTYVPLR